MLVLVLARPGVRLKTVAPFVFCSGYELPVTTRFLVGGRFICIRGGEFMRKFVGAMCVVAGLAGHAAFAEEGAGKDQRDNAMRFAEGGTYIPPGESREITIADDCRVLTNLDAVVGFYITPALHKTWPEKSVPAPLEPVVTEEPCK